MNLKYRLSYFLIGFAISSFAVVFFLSKKGATCTYFPNDRVLNDIKRKPFQYSDKASQIIAQDWIDTIDVKNTLEYGDVDFSRSNKPHKHGKLYTIEGRTTKNQPLELIIENYEDKAVLSDIVKK